VVEHIKRAITFVSNVLGVVIGIASVFTILTLSAGVTSTVNSELGRLGSGVLQLTVSPACRKCQFH